MKFFLRFTLGMARVIAAWFALFYIVRYLMNQNK